MTLRFILGAIGAIVGWGLCEKAVLPRFFKSNPPDQTHPEGRKPK